MVKRINILSISLLTASLLSGVAFVGSVPVHSAFASENVNCEIDEVKTKTIVSTKAVEDKYGCYTKIKINPKSSLLDVNSKKVDAKSIKDTGFTTKDVEGAQHLATKFFVEQTLDSTILDNSANSLKWLNHVEGYFGEETFKTYKAQIKKDGVEATGLTLSGFLPEPIRRDGSVRATTTQVELEKVSGATTEAGEPIIKVTLSGETTYKIKDSSFSRWVISQRSDMTKAKLKDLHPELFDNKGINPLTAKVTSTFSVRDNEITGVTTRIVTL